MIIQSQIKQYRVPFFQLLYRKLADDRISFRVAYSDPSDRERQKMDNFDLPTDYGVKVNAYWTLRRNLIWQPLLNEVAKADLIVVEQANKFLMNYLLFAGSGLGLKKVAFWGHGRNRQSRRRTYSEWLKERALNWVNWWFAYTKGTVEYLVQHGVRPDRITEVQNSTDTTTFRNQLAAVSDAELGAARTQLGISASSKVGLFCGGITRDKLPQFLIESLLRIKQRVPSFEVLILGGGPEQSHLEQAASRNPWIHYLGARFGQEKALYFRLSHLFLMPGLVGLAILDSFTAGLPVFTTDIPTHSPEIEYLEAGRNGCMTQYNTEVYSSEVARVLTDSSAMRELREGALISAGKYSIETMTRNFYHGIMQCLQVCT